MNKSKSAGPTTFFIDGGSRGNPGPAGYGVVVKDAREQVVDSISEFIGVRTNNVAEYSGLLAALHYALGHDLSAVRIFSDSELLVRQMNGQYKVKSPDLRPLFEQAQALAAKIPNFRIEHVRREFNREADALANEAMDRAAPASTTPAVMRFDAIIEDGRVRPLARLSLPEKKVVECTLRFKS